jgi:hypothetical protein
LNIRKSIFSILGILAATSLLTAGGFTAPALADQPGDYDKIKLKCYVYSDESDEQDDYDHYFENDGDYYYCYEYINDNKHDN